MKKIILGTLFSLLALVVSANELPNSVISVDVIAPQHMVTVGQQMFINGNHSNDVETSLRSYYWKQLEGNPISLSSNRTKAITFTIPDSPLGHKFVLSLKVTDRDGGINTNTIAFTVSEYDPPVQFTGILKVDDDGYGITYTWDQLSGRSFTLIPKSGTMPIPLPFELPAGLTFIILAVEEK